MNGEEGLTVSCGGFEELESRRAQRPGTDLDRLNRILGAHFTPRVQSGSSSERSGLERPVRNPDLGMQRCRERIGGGALRAGPWKRGREATRSRRHWREREKLELRVDDETSCDAYMKRETEWWKELFKCFIFIGDLGFGAEKEDV